VPTPIDRLSKIERELRRVGWSFCLIGALLLVAALGAWWFGRIVHLWLLPGFIAIVAGDQRKELAEERLNLIGSLAHLPVGGDYFFSHGEFLSIFRGDRAPDSCNFSKAAA